MKASSISKMNTIFGFLVPKMLEMSNFIDPTQLFQKLWGLLFCNFQYLKVPLCKSCAKVTSHRHKMHQIHQIQTWITHEIMKLLIYFFRCSSWFLKVFWSTSKNHMQKSRCQFPFNNIIPLLKKVTTSDKNC